ncbi:hypothetical protein J6590_096359 [Homalodisca vitripennis]|nr:hypothetical protein J6590_096359 [Homalodisca vitripennis]
MKSNSSISPCLDPGLCRLTPGGDFLTSCVLNDLRYESVLALSRIVFTLVPGRAFLTQCSNPIEVCIDQSDTLLDVTKVHLHTNIQPPVNVTATPSQAQPALVAV